MLAGQNATILLNQFSDIKSIPSLDALVLGADYTITANPFLDGTISSSKELALSAAIDAKQGDEILLDIDGYFYKNIIDNISTDQLSLLLVNNVKNKNGILKTGSIKIKRNVGYIVKLIDLDEGHYLIQPSNQKLVIRKSWVQPEVSFSEISAKLKDAGGLNESRLEQVRQLALKFIYSDLSGFDNYYDIIDEIDLFPLLFVKMECILSIDYNFKQEWYRPCEKYDNLIMSYKPDEKFEEDSDGSPSDIITTEIATGDYSL